MTVQQLHAFTSIDCTELQPALDATCLKYEITTPLRVCHFLAQMYVESGDFQKLVENLNYSPARLTSVWPARFPTLSAATPYAHNPQALANFVYGNRMGNGPPESGDGYRYRGRGLLMNTGRSAYQQLTDDLGHDFVNSPDDLAQVQWATMAAGWFWDTKGLNTLADNDDITRITKKINGGLTDLMDRKMALIQAKKIWQ